MPIPRLTALWPQFLATFVSSHAHPTLRQWENAASHAFYRHGRLCASNQAKVMVLVIVFVGMISYPGIITYYNTSSYALSTSSQKHHGPLYYHNGNRPKVDLDAFWSGIIEQTWSQDPAVFQTRWPTMTKPMHYLAPIVINATDTSHKYEDGQGPGVLSDAEVLVYAAQIQDRIERMTVDYEYHPSSRHDPTENKVSVTSHTTFPHDTSGKPTGKSHSGAQPVFTDRAHRTVKVSLQDICVFEPEAVGGPRDNNNIHINKQNGTHATAASTSTTSETDAVDDQNKITGQKHRQQRRCLVQSPVAYWDNDIDRIRADPDILTTISSQRHSTSPLSQSTLFGGHVVNNETNQIHGASSVIMTFFLRGNAADLYAEEYDALDGIHDDVHVDWEDEHNRTIHPRDLDVVKIWNLLFQKLAKELAAERELAQQLQQLQQQWNGEDAFEESRNQDSELDRTILKPNSLDWEFPLMQVSQNIAFGHGGFQRLLSEEMALPKSEISAEYWLLGMAYFVMFLYISLSVGRVDLVKSKYGLGIAAVATVFVSLLMSIGLCSVFGITLTLMPWEILPFMIIVVGVENINILVHAVVETSMDLPVKERVGRGLGSVGVSITMTLVAELCLLIVGAMTTIPAVQEFCTFAIAAVIMDYLLQMTFFITVISIDIRRLELSDLNGRPGSANVPLVRYPTGHHHGHHHYNHQSGATSYQHPHYSTTGQSFLQKNGSQKVTSKPQQTLSFLGSSDDHRRGSTASNQSDNESSSANNKSAAGKKTGKKNPRGRVFTSIIMVGVMTFLGYIYGTTNQTNFETLAKVSFWHISSPQVASAFWSLVDPANKGGYLEICPPVVLTMVSFTDLVCESDPNCKHPSTEPIAHGGDEGLLLPGGEDNDSDLASDGQLDPRGPFKLLKNVFVFALLFAIWLIRVFVIPSIIMAAAILLLLSYLLSPQRKLLVDLQWSFPFIVLPGDYQSKRKLMMEELLRQEREEIGGGVSPYDVATEPLMGTVTTLKRGGHETDIDQMDVNHCGWILSLGMDGTLLLWDGSHDPEQTSRPTVPRARLDTEVFRFAGETASQNGIRPCLARSNSMVSNSAIRAYSFKRLARCLKLEDCGAYAAVGYSDGTVQVWEIKLQNQEAPSKRSSLTFASQPSTSTTSVCVSRELTRTGEIEEGSYSQEALAKFRVMALCFWNSGSRSVQEGDQRNVQRQRDQKADRLIIGYRDGQLRELDLVSGHYTSMDTKHRGGIIHVSVVALDAAVTSDLGLTPKVYCITAGKDGGIQCWVRPRVPTLMKSKRDAEWTRIWGQPGDGKGSYITVLSTMSEVPMVAAGYSNGALKVWDLEHGNLVWTLCRGSVLPSNLAPGLGTGDHHYQQQHQHHRRKSSLGINTVNDNVNSNNHQPSHQGAVTKVVFKPLELEDGITGEPAPRIWLVISSSMDETIMIWMVEWEGLMNLPATNTASLNSCNNSNSVDSSGGNTLISTSTAKLESTTGITSIPAVVGNNGHALNSLLQTSPSASPAPPPISISTGPQPPIAVRSNSVNNIQQWGLLSSSLPSPRLVGFMRQRGGKSMAIRHSSVYGVRRKELNPAKVPSSTTSSLVASKAAAAAANMFGGSGSGGNGHHRSGSRSSARRKSEGQSHSSVHFQDSPPTITSSKRGWEVWEADLYQCIFRDSGIWGLELGVRAIDLQPPERGPPLQQQEQQLRANMEHVAANTNGSSVGGLQSQAKLRRRPGSFAAPGPSGGLATAEAAASVGLMSPLLSSSNNQGFIFTTERSTLFPSASGRPESFYGGSPSINSSLNLHGGSDVDHDTDFDSIVEHELLPFVETRHIFAISTDHASSNDHNHDIVQGDQENAQEDVDESPGGIVVGFGNWIKVVRLEGVYDPYEEVLTHQHLHHNLHDQSIYDQDRIEHNVVEGESRGWRR